MSSRKSDAEVRFFGAADQRLAEARVRGQEVALLYKTILSDLVDVFPKSATNDQYLAMLALDLTKHSLNLDVWTKRPSTDNDPPPTSPVP